MIDLTPSVEIVAVHTPGAPLPQVSVDRDTVIVCPGRECSGQARLDGAGSDQGHRLWDEQLALVTPSILAPEVAAAIVGVA